LTTTIGDNCAIRFHTVIYAGNKIGNNFQTGHGVNIREFNEIGDNVSIGTHSIIEHHIKMVVTNNEGIAKKIKLLRNHGPITKKYGHKVEEYSSRLDNLQAAILRVELRHLNKLKTM